LDKNWTYYGKIFFLFLLLFFIFFPKLMKNYLALKMPGHAGDLFNDAISKLLRIQRKYPGKQERQQHHCYYYDDNKI
jgi:hypothetical protein